LNDGCGKSCLAIGVLDVDVDEDAGPYCTGALSLNDG
jgi:hypothetical protein